MTDQMKTIMRARQLLLEADNSWSGYSDEQTSVALEKIERLNGDLLGLEFSNPGTKLLGLEILLLGDDQPNFADDFKNELFERLRQFRS